MTTTRCERERGVSASAEFAIYFPFLALITVSLGFGFLVMRSDLIIQSGLASLATTAVERQDYSAEDPLTKLPFVNTVSATPVKDIDHSCALVSEGPIRWVECKARWRLGGKHFGGWRQLKARAFVSMDLQ